MATRIVSPQEQAAQENMKSIQKQVATQASLDAMANIAKKVYNDKYIPQFYMAIVKQVNDDGTINVMTNGSTTQLTNIPNYTRCDLGVNDKVYLLAIQGDLTNCCALFACGAAPPKIGYAGAYLYADNNSGTDAGLVCENSAQTSKTVINSQKPFTVYKLENGNWVQVGGITAEGDFCASRLTNEIDNTDFYAIVGANENNNPVFEVHRVQSDNTDVKIFQFWQDVGGDSVIQYGNGAFIIEDKNNNVKMSIADAQVSLYDTTDKNSVVVNKDGLGIINPNGYYHSFNTNPTTNVLQTDGVDTWSGQYTMNGLTFTYKNGLLTTVVPA